MYQYCRIFGIVFIIFIVGLSSLEAGDGDSAKTAVSPYQELRKTVKSGNSEAICQKLKELIDTGRTKKCGAYYMPANEYAYYLSNWENKDWRLLVYPITKSELNDDIKRGRTSLSGPSRFTVLSFIGKAEVQSDNVMGTIVERMKKLDENRVKHPFSIQMAPFVLDCKGLVIIAMGQTKTARVSLGGLHANPTHAFFFDVLPPRYLKKYNIDIEKLEPFPIAHYFSGDAKDPEEFKKLYSSDSATDKKTGSESAKK